MPVIALVPHNGHSELTQTKQHIYYSKPANAPYKGYNQSNNSTLHRTDIEPTQSKLSNAPNNGNNQSKFKERRYSNPVEAPMPTLVNQ